MTEEVLLAMQNKPLSPQEIWEQAKILKLDQKLGSKGQTPWSSVSSLLLVDVRDKQDSAFSRVSTRPAKYILKNVEISKISVGEVNKNSEIPSIEDNDLPSINHLVPDKAVKYPYKERDLHPFVVRFAHYNFRGVYAKTIFHEKSSKRSYTEWLHPDMVGFWFPFNDYTKELLELSGRGLSIIKFFSFELKRELNFGNLRESFFQAVSNSSWAHEGYLVAANVDDSEDLREELSRLSGSFGIGVIEINLENPESSQVIFPAKPKETIDWNGANKLARENPDFASFLQDVHIDVTHALVHRERFDSICSLDDLSKLWDSWSSKIKAD